MQDAALPDVSDYKVKAPIKCVYSFLEQKCALAILDEPSLSAATRCVVGLNTQERADEFQKKKMPEKEL